eukprot:6666606-Alexandrium_andersonii.AAC.1
MGPTEFFQWPEANARTMHESARAHGLWNKTSLKPQGAGSARHNWNLHTTRCPRVQSEINPRAEG